MRRCVGQVGGGARGRVAVYTACAFGLNGQACTQDSGAAAVYAVLHRRQASGRARGMRAWRERCSGSCVCGSALGGTTLDRNHCRPAQELGCAGLGVIPLMAVCGVRQVSGGARGRRACRQRSCGCGACACCAACCASTATPRRSTATCTTTCTRRCAALPRRVAAGRGNCRVRQCRAVVPCLAAAADRK